jgi:aminoglycoside N3'-acetyltransferase
MPKVKSRKSVKRTSKSKKSGKGRKLNAFFTRMLKAKKSNEPSFEYNGKTYKQFTAKTGLKMYKKA